MLFRSMKEMEVEESDKEYYDYVNAKTDLILEDIKEDYEHTNSRIDLLWYEFDILKQRVSDLENRPQVQPPSKYQDYGTWHWYYPSKVTCNSNSAGIVDNHD